MGLPAGLVKLSVKGCVALKSFPSGGLPTSLETLEIRGCREIVLPDGLENCYTSLTCFTLFESCDSLKYFPLSSFPEILYLNIEGCRNLEIFSISNKRDKHHHIQLGYVSIGSCPKLISSSFGCLPAPNLRDFRIYDCKIVKSLPSFPSLENLYIKGCPEIEYLTEGCLSPRLNCLFIGDCQKLVARRVDWGLKKLPSLRWVTISGDYEEDEWKTFPEELMLPSSLRVLQMIRCRNLKALNHKGLHHLTSLTALHFIKCPQLKSLSDKVLPSSITQLIVEDCSSLLKQRLKGEDWPHISHIPFIMLDAHVL